MSAVRPSVLSANSDTLENPLASPSRSYTQPLTVPSQTESEKALPAMLQAAGWVESEGGRTGSRIFVPPTADHVARSLRFFAADPDSARRLDSVDWEGEEEVSRLLDAPDGVVTPEIAAVSPQSLTIGCALKILQATNPACSEARGAVEKWKKYRPRGGHAVGLERADAGADGGAE